MDTVRHVLFYVPTKPGNLILAEMGDGSLCILRNDQPVPDCRWKGADMVKAVAHFHEMKARFASGTSEIA